MRSHTHITIRQILFGAVFLAAFTVLTIFLFTYRRDERRFDNLSTRLFREELSSNTLNMHYTLAYPVNFGIYDYDVILPCYSSDNRLTSQAQTENILASLRSLKPSRLSTEADYTRRLLLESLDNSLAMSAYPYYEEPLAPSSGMQSQLPILLAEYTFRSSQDVEDYLKLLDQTDDYFASLLTFEQEKAQAGYLMAASSLKKVIEQCDTILTMDELEAETHFLQTTFRERLEGLLSSQEITRDEALAYMAQNDRLLKTVMLPAYEALADGLFVLEDDTIPLSGLAARPDGNTYYEHLLFSETGSSRPVSEIKELLLKQFQQEYESIRQIITEQPSLAALGYDDGLAGGFPYKTAVQMLTDLQQRMQKDFPPLNAKEALPAVNVKSVSSSLQDYCAPAFYLTPPLDDTSANVIYINEKNSPCGLELYTTLAHEGYPGHMYQSVFHNRTQMDSDSSHVRQILWYGGYLEGWALYVEFISFDYASQLFTEQGQAELAAAVQLEKHNRSLQLCLYSLLDIMIHYENADQSQITRVLNSFGIKNESSVSAIYQYIVEEPANYLKYYLGYLEILSLQEQAQRLWQDNYSDYAFHTFFLTCGPSGFSLLQDELARWEMPKQEAASLTAAFGVWDAGITAALGRTAAFPLTAAVFPGRTGLRWSALSPG